MAGVAASLSLHYTPEWVYEETKGDVRLEADVRLLWELGNSRDNDAKFREAEEALLSSTYGWEREIRKQVIVTAVLR